MYPSALVIMFYSGMTSMSFGKLVSWGLLKALTTNLGGKPKFRIKSKP